MIADIKNTFTSSTLAKKIDYQLAKVERGDGKEFGFPTSGRQPLGESADRLARTGLSATQQCVASRRQ